MSQDFKYCISDLTKVYIGLEYHFDELASDEKIPFKFRSLVVRFLQKEETKDMTIGESISFIKTGEMDYLIYQQLKAKVKFYYEVRTKNRFGKEKTSYEERSLPLTELLQDPDFISGDYMLREISFSKMALNSLNAG